MKRIKIKVFYSRGGGGHLSASAAITGYLNGRYDITAVNPFDEILARLDPMRKLSCNRLSGEDTYNYLIRHGWYRLINIYACRFGASYITATEPRIRRLVRAYFEREKPDLIISLIPFINAPLAAAAQERGIPFVILPIDLDPETYLCGMKGSQHKHIFFAIPCDREEIKVKIISAGMLQENIRVTGYPVRPAFLSPCDPGKIRKSLGISCDRLVIFLLMGASGAKRVVSFTHMIERINLPVDLLIGIGRNNKLQDRLAGLPSVPHVQRLVIGHTERIDKLMKAADLLITKSGPGTIFEALHSELPMVIDATTRVIQWEAMNISFVEEHDLGVVLRRLDDLPHLASRYLWDDAYRAEKKRNFRALDKRLFPDEFPALVRDIAGG
jgi:UDP-N-acetylglucosamine:LPS N-acetylglucosamine transferase